MISIAFLGLWGCVSQQAHYPMGSEKLQVDGFVPTEALQDLSDTGDEPRVERRGGGTTSGKSSFYLSSHLVRNLHPLIKQAEDRLKTKPYDLESFKILAYRALMEGNPDGVLIYMRTAEGRSRSLDDESYVMMGIAWLVKGKEKEGFAALDRAASINPANILVDLNKGVYLLEHGEVVPARKLLKRVLDKAPESTVAHFQLGRAEYLQKNYIEAEKHLREATYGFFERDVARLTLGYVYQVGFRDYTKAHTSFSDLKDDPFANLTMQGLANGALKDLENDFKGVGSQTVFDKK